MVSWAMTQKASPLTKWQNLSPQRGLHEVHRGNQKGWKFHNGEEVTSDNFIKAWTFGADTKNGQLGSDFFANIKGFDELNGEKRTTDSLSGLRKIDDHKFTVELSAPESTWPLRLGYSSYVPLPKVAFEDMAAFGEHPIGNGVHDGRADAWTHNVNIRLKPFDGYSGHDKPQNKGLNFVFTPVKIRPMRICRQAT